MVFSSEAVAVLRDQLTEVFDLVAQRNMRRLALTPREVEVLQLLPTSMTLTRMARTSSSRGRRSRTTPPRSTASWVRAAGRRP